MKWCVRAGAVQARDSLLQEQLRADCLAGQRNSLERTLAQAQQALHEQAPSGDLPRAFSGSGAQDAAGDSPTSHDAACSPTGQPVALYPQWLEAERPAAQAWPRLLDVFSDA